MQALASDSAPRLDSSGYGRYCLQKFARILEPLPGVFLKERLKENDEWLWRTFEFFERQGRVLMLVHHLTWSAPEWRFSRYHLPERDTE
jgi:hypothetical protein